MRDLLRYRCRFLAQTLMNLAARSWMSIPPGRARLALQLLPISMGRVFVPMPDDINPDAALRMIDAAEVRLDGAVSRVLLVLDHAASARFVEGNGGLGD